MSAIVTGLILLLRTEVEEGNSDQQRQLLGCTDGWRDVLTAGLYRRVA